MDRFLTNGARSIPKLVALDAGTLQVVGTWGPRPEAAQDRYRELKEQGKDKLFVMEELQRWYNEDRGRSIQAEFRELAAQWTREKSALGLAI